MKQPGMLQTAVLALLLILATSATAAEVQRRGGVYYVYLPATNDFVQVVKHLETEIENKNWEVLKEQDIDKGLKANYQMDVQSKVVYACKSQYLAQAIKEDPNITLIVPCRFAVYRVDAAGKAVGGTADRSGKIVIGISDPVAEARHLGIKQVEAAGMAGKELREILEDLAAFYGTK